MITKKAIDNGNPFDWGKTSSDYAKYRDIYPQEFYDKLIEFGICTKNQNVLDIGTGTGVVPRNMYKYGAKFTGIDISENQIKQAKLLSESAGMNIDYYCKSVEEIDYPKNSFDVITACQCFHYFDHNIFATKASKILRLSGKLAVLYMEWLPFEDKIASTSEKLVLKYNSVWSGCGETRHEIYIPKVYDKYFEVDNNIVFDLNVPFTRESWNGRIKACRGIGASLSNNEIKNFESEHLELLKKIAPENFNILHYVAIKVLSRKK